MHELRDFRDAIRREIILLDNRLSQVEETAIAEQAKSLGVAETVDVLDAESLQRSTARREWFRIVVAAASVGATASLFLWGIFEYIMGNNLI
jgi:hypothetical protein